MKSDQDIIQNVVDNLWRRRLAVYGTQRTSALWVLALGMGIMLFLMPMTQFKTITFLAKAFALSVLVFIAAFAHLTKIIGKLIFGKHAHQLFILLVNIYFIAFCVEVCVWLLYNSQYLLILSSIQIPAILILGVFALAILITILMSPPIIRGRLQKNQSKEGISIPKMLVLASAGPGLGLLASVVSHITGKEYITWAILGSFIMLSAIFLMSTMTYALCEFVFIAFRKWPEI